MKVTDFLTPDMVFLHLESSTKMEIFAELSSLISNSCPELIADVIQSKLVERERLTTTGIGMGIAIPHAKIENIDTIYVAVGVSRYGVHFDAIDGNLVHTFCLLLAPMFSTSEYIETLACAYRLFKNLSLKRQLLAIQTSYKAYELIRETEEEQ